MHKKLNFRLDNRALSLALRPKSFEKMYGQDAIITALRKLYASKREHQVWMFYGEPGVGKTTFAKILARSFNCTHKVEFGSYCSKCSENDYDIAELNGAKLNTVEAISQVIDFSSYTPNSGSRRKIIIIDEIHRLSKDAQQLLLKPTEPKNLGKTIWIFCTTMPNKIDPALKSRCMSFNVPGLTSKEIERFVKWAAKKADITRDLDDFLEYLKKHNVTSPRNILMALEKFGSGIDPEKAAAAATSHIDIIRICKGIIAGEWGHLRSELNRAIPEEVRQVRAGILGYFKYLMMEHTPGVSRKLLAEVVESLASIPYSIEDVSQLALLCARVYKLTEKFGKK